MAQWRHAEVASKLPQMLPQNQPLLIPVNTKNINSAELWIAHGGGVGQFRYTNCKEAIINSIEKGFRYIEIDFLETTCGHLVGAHSWKELRHMIGAEITDFTPMSKSEILALRPKWNLTPVFSENICEYLETNPHLVLVTDKVQNFELLMQEIPFADRMIIEASDCYNYLQALRAGAKNVALSAWSVSDLRTAEKFHLPGVVLSATVMQDSASIPLIKRMHLNGCCISVHESSICDKVEFIHTHLGKNISRIYTDTWSPVNPPPVSSLSPPKLDSPSTFL